MTFDGLSLTTILVADAAARARSRPAQFVIILGVAPLATGAELLH